MSRYKPSGKIRKEQIDALYQGCIDMHIHPAPDPSCSRRLDAVETVQEAERGGMRAVVLKSFFYPTTVLAQAAQHSVETLRVFGSVTISNTATGGLEYAPQTVEMHARLGCKLLWFPAADAAYQLESAGRSGGIRILDDNGLLKREAKELLEIARAYDMVVCKGHMSFPETEALFLAARDMGIEKLVATHPLADTWGRFRSEEIARLAELGAYIEHVFGALMPRLNSIDPADYVDCIHAIGAGRSLMSSDLAQCMDPTPAEGMRFFIGTMLQFGCTEEEVEKMVKHNPAQLLGLS